MALRTMTSQDATDMASKMMATALVTKSPCVQTWQCRIGIPWVLLRTSELFENKVDGDDVPHGFGHTIALARNKFPALHSVDGSFIQTVKAAGLLDFDLFGLALLVDVYAQQHLCLAHPCACSPMGRRAMDCSDRPHCLKAAQTWAGPVEQEGAVSGRRRWCWRGGWRRRWGLVRLAIVVIQRAFGGCGRRRRVLDRLWQRRSLLDIRLGLRFGCRPWWRRRWRRRRRSGCWRRRCRRNSAITLQEPLSLPVFAVPGHAAWPIGWQRAQQPQH